MGFRLSKSVVDVLPFSERGQVIYRDSDLKGFGVRIGAKTKVYIAEGKLNNRTVRHTIGRHDVFTAEQARTEARVVLGQLARGHNPNQKAKEERIRRVTLEEAFEDFLLARKNLSPLTIRDYRRHMNTNFADWRRKALTDITKDMVERRHRLKGETSPSQANASMRFLRALFNFAIGRYEDAKGNSILLFNPVSRLSHTRAWYRISRRQTVIKSHELAAWFHAVLNADASNHSMGDIFRDYLLLLILTGLRRGEAARLVWENIDFVGRTLYVPDTKNHEGHMLPLSDYLFDLLQRRHAARISDYVFPGIGSEGYINEPRKFMNLVMAASGVKFRLHDLRRTFITIAESLDIPAYALKRLLNHKMTNDVTAGYIVADVERLRVPMQRVTDYMLRAANLRESGQVVQLGSAVAK